MGVGDIRKKLGHFLETKLEEVSKHFRKAEKMGESWESGVITWYHLMCHPLSLSKFLGFSVFMNSFPVIFCVPQIQFQSGIQLFLLFFPTLPQFNRNLHHLNLRLKIYLGNMIKLEGFEPNRKEDHQQNLMRCRFWNENTFRGSIFIVKSVK